MLAEVQRGKNGVIHRDLGLAPPAGGLAGPTTMVATAATQRPAAREQVDPA